MSRSRLLFAPAVLAACTFTSVGPVGKAIDATIERREALVPVSETCWLGDATRKRGEALPPKKSGEDQSDEAKVCEYDDEAKSLDGAIGRLGRYGKSLASVAGKKDIDPADTVEALIDIGNEATTVDISSGEKGGIAVASTLLAKAFLTMQRRHELRAVVAETDRAVQCTAYRGLAAVSVFRRSAEQLVDLETDADALRYRKPRRPLEPVEHAPTPSDPVSDPGRPEPDGSKVVERLAAHDETLTDHDEKTYRTLAIAYRQAALTGAQLSSELEALERGYKAIAVAHNTLACQRKRLGTPEDKDLAAEIATAVACVTGAPETAGGLDPDDRRDLAALCKEVREHAVRVESDACNDLQVPASGEGEDPQPLPPVCPVDEASTAQPEPQPSRRKNQ